MNAEYTPSVERVRLVYARTADFPEDGFAEFDRWLSRVRADASAGALNAIWNELAGSNTIHTPDAAMVRIKERANEWQNLAESP